MRTIVCVISDTHIGSSLAVAPPTFQQHTGREDETQTVQASKVQLWLMECLRDFVDYAKTLAGICGKERKSRFVFIHLGDVIEGIHHHSVQLENEIEDQQAMAYDLLRPIVSVADASFLAYGTPAHSGEAAKDEIAIARELGMRHGWDFALDIDGMTLDLAHVGRAGMRDWTSSAVGLAVEVSLDYIKDKKLPPRFVLRGHRHRIDDSGARLPYTRAIMLPSWQLRTSYGHQAAPNQKRADVGGLILDTSNPDFPITTKMRYSAPGGYIHVEKV